MRDSLRDIIEEVVRGLSPDQAAIFILNEDKDTSLTMSQRQEHLTGREELRLKRAEVRRQIGRETGKRQKRQRTHQLRLVTIHQKEKEQTASEREAAKREKEAEKAQKAKEKAKAKPKPEREKKPEKPGVTTKRTKTSYVISPAAKLKTNIQALSRSRSADYDPGGVIPPRPKAGTS